MRRNIEEKFITYCAVSDCHGVTNKLQTYCLIDCQWVTWRGLVSVTSRESLGD